MDSGAGLFCASGDFHCAVFFSAAGGRDYRIRQFQKMALGAAQFRGVVLQDPAQQRTEKRQVSGVGVDVCAGRGDYLHDAVQQGGGGDCADNHADV